MNTYLLYCRFQKMRGGFTEAEYATRDRASSARRSRGIDEPHWREYLAAWPVEASAPARVGRCAQPRAGERPRSANDAGAGPEPAPVAIVETTTETNTTDDAYIDSSSIRA